MKLSTDLRDAIETSSTTSAKALNNEIDTRTFATSKRNNTKKDFDEAPRHDLKIIIAKKSSSRSIKNIGSVVGNNNKIRLNKPNGNGSKVLSDFERLRGDVDNVQFSSASSSEIVSTSETKKTFSKKSGTVSHHDSKLENKSSNTKKQHNSASHDYYYESTMNEREKEKCYSEKHSRRESTKHHAKNNEKVEKFKASKSNLSLNNIPKLKIELPSLKTKITVPKTPTDKYVISSKSPSNSNSPKCETPLKKVRFDISPRERERCYEFNDDADINSVDQMEYAESLGLKPVERKVESIILHRKRKKSKHSKETEHSKRPKLHVSSSLDESLKLKLKIMGGKSCKSDKKSNEDEAHSREKTTCNLKALQCKTADLTPINVQEEKQQREKQQKEAEDVVVGLENHKYSVSEQNHKYSVSGSDQPMVFIPKLVLQKTQIASTSFDKKESPGVTGSESQRRNSFVVEQSKPNSTDANESLRLKVKSLDSMGLSESSNQKSMKPPTAKMGSPKQSHMTTFSLNPNRPHSIPASLKLSLISRSPTPSTEFQQMQNQLKRSLSLGAEKSSPPYSNTFIKPNTNYFSSISPDTMNIPFSKLPPLVSSSSTSAVRNFYESMANTNTNHKSQSQSPQHASKLPNINVKDPTKLFPNACPSVEILKIPQQKKFTPVENIKLNRPMPTTISLEKIRKSAQTPVAQKILPKPQMNQNSLKATSFNQPPQCSSGQGINYSGIYQTPINRDVSLERYTLELTHDIAKLDRSLSLEKNYEDWEKKKLQEYSKLNELKNFPMMTKNLLNQQQNLSVRNIPNPSAIIMSRNQTLSNNCYKGNLNDALKTGNMSPQKVTSTNSEQSDIEDILSKTTIAKANEKHFSDHSSQKLPLSKVSDKKSIEKLTEYLRLAAKSKDVKDDDNNNNNNPNVCDEPTANNRNFNLHANKSDKFLNVPSVDVICIDS